MAWKWPQQPWSSRLLSQAQSIFIVKLLMPPKALERLSKTVSTIHNFTGAGCETGRKCRDEQSLCPQNSAVGSYKALKLCSQYPSLTPTCAHLPSLPWLMRWGAAPFTCSHTFLHLLQNEGCISLSRKYNRHFQMVSSTAKYDLLASMHVGLSLGT